MIENEQQVRRISFRHPLYKNVFDSEVENFDYPSLYSYYPLVSNGSTALELTDGSPFLTTSGRLSVFAGSLRPENSNFSKSPLIVPTFYRLGEQGLQNADPYQIIGTPANLDVAHDLEKDDILKLVGEKSEFIPLQQSFSNKVRLRFENLPRFPGVYAVMHGKDTLQHLSFNYKRTESELNYLNADALPFAAVYGDISPVLRKFEEETAITDYWKWFVMLTLLFAILELLIQKLLK